MRVMSIKYKGNDLTVVVPDGIKHIDSCAFAKCGMKKTTINKHCSCFTVGEYDRPFFFENRSEVIQLENLSVPGIVLLCGKSGTGKTHLLELIAADYNDKHPEMNVKIQSASNLVEEIFNSVSKGIYLDYIEEKSRVGILLMDDFDAPAAWYIRKELIRIINAVQQHGGLCVISSSRYFESNDFKSSVKIRLKNGQYVRFLCGCEKARQEGYNIPRDAIAQMSKKARSVTELFGYMHRYVFEHCLDSDFLC